MSGPPAPIPLLLELFDLLQLAFPHPVRSASLAFGPRHDEERSVMTDLSGEHDEASPSRPDLGYPDEEILDTLNEVVGDLCAATEVDPATPGVIHIEREKLEEGDAALAPGIQARILLGDDETEHFVRRLAHSELFRLVHTPALFSTLASTQEAEDRSREALATRLRTADGQPAGRFELDFEKGQVQFPDTAEAEPPTFRFELLASYHQGSQTFVWGWANESFPSALRSAVDEVRLAATDFGMRAFAAPELLAPARMADRLARHAGCKLDALYVLRASVAAGAVEGAGPLDLYLGLWEDA